MAVHTIEAVYTPLDAILLLLTVLVMPALSYRAGRQMARQPDANLIPRYRGIFARGLFVTLLVLVDWSSAGRPFGDLGLDWPIGTKGVIGFIVAALIGLYYMWALLLRRIDPKNLDRYRRHLAGLRIVPRTRGEFALFALVAVNGGIMEELAYRGFLIWAFAPLAGLWGAALLSSLIFGLGHAYQGAKGIVRTGALGLFFAVGYVLTRSLWWLMLTHMMVNLFGAAFQARLLRLAREQGTS